ncbi:hypothetical protein [Bdellovibrio sp. HCB2-146]|uniref:hypothetical protein n=1 Tax=Bdellovibrio sp. HCB2-146 TaxID=3394362 RepID=UPI0039BD3A62
MRSIQDTKNTKANVESESVLNDSLTSSLPETFVSHKSYHELSDRTLVECDVLSQLAANIETLSDLQARFSFVMREVRYVLKV